MSFGAVAILGPGLIGGSLALALTERGLADRLTIYARKESSFTELRKKLPKALLTTDAIEAVRGADIVVLCVPVECMAELTREMGPALKPTALVTDVGSVKESVDRELAPLLAGKAQWIGSHPMAGSEQAGFAAARPDLFVNAPVVLTPTENTRPEAKTRARELWAALKARVFEATPHRHDQLVAEISHLPHLVAAALVNQASKEARELAAGGFRDTTRVASGSPELWAEILLANKAAIANSLGDLIVLLTGWQEMIAQGQKSELLRELGQAHASRSQLLENNPLPKKSP